MPLIDFPASPAVNDEYAFGSRTWLWNGSGWELKSAATQPGAYNVTTTATSKTIVNNEFVTVTAAGQTITLPATPTAGNQVIVGVLNFSNTVVARNGSNIMGLAEDVTIDIVNSSYLFIYVNATYGWRIIQ